MLMAAGLGTRLRPFTELEPKALLPVMGAPCAQFALDALSAAGVRRVVANVHHLAARAREGLGALPCGDAELQFSDESALLLGSAGGLARALPALGDAPFFLVNADVLCDVDLLRLSRCHARLRERYGVSLTLTVFPRPRGAETYREILLDPESGSGGLVRGLGELARGRPYFVGIAVIEPEALRGIPVNEPSDFVPKILAPAIEQGKAGYFLDEGCWLDIGSPALWAQAHFDLMRRLETGQISPAWRHRIESLNRRIGQQMWVSRRTRRGFATADWWAPAYFSELGDSTARPPRRFGANAVLYGNAPSQAEDQRFHDEISYRGIVEKLASSRPRPA